MRVIEKFGGYTFPTYETEEDLPREFASAIVDTVGDGGFDALGFEGQRRVARVTKRCMILGSSYSDVDTQVDSLLRELGKGRKCLKALMRDGGTYRVMWAKAVDVQMPRKATESEKNFVHLPVTVVFEGAWPYWEAFTDVWYLDTGEVLDGGLLLDGCYTTRSVSSSPDTFTINNTATARIIRGLIVLKDFVAAPKLENKTNGWWVQYTGVVQAGATLVIDIGALSAKKNGSDVWSSISMGDDQNSPMEFELGSNEMEFTAQPGCNCTLEVHWAKCYH